MDRTNAERQRRYIAKLKAAAAQPRPVTNGKLEEELAQAQARIALAQSGCVAAGRVPSTSRSNSALIVRPQFNASEHAQPPMQQQQQTQPLQPKRNKGGAR